MCPLCDFSFNEGFDVQIASAFCRLRTEGKSRLHSSREWFAFRRTTLVEEMRQRKRNRQRPVLRLLRLCAEIWIPLVSRDHFFNPSFCVAMLLGQGVSGNPH